MSEVNEEAAGHLALALKALGFSGDPEMEQTPQLLAGLLSEFLPAPTPPEVSAFPAPGHDLIVLRELPFHSLCAHHLLPFFGAATVAYIPRDRIAGLGSFPRMLEHFARRPQLQERLGAGLADALFHALDPISLGVKITARQLCMEMRGARSAGTVSLTVLRGAPNEELKAALRDG